jgi:hypothetical protein
MPSSYWCGRFQTLHDHLRNEILDAITDNPELFQRYLDTKVPSPGLKQRNWGKAKENGMASSPQCEDLVDENGGEKLLREDEEKIVKRVLAQLEKLCVSSAAKKSLWEWQLTHARKSKNENLLPAGGKLDDKEGWASRVGRVISGNKSVVGANTSLVKKNGLGMHGKKKMSMTEMNR